MKAFSTVVAIARKPLTWCIVAVVLLQTAFLLVFGATIWTALVRVAEYVGDMLTTFWPF